MAALPAAFASERLDLLKSMFLGVTLTAFFYEVFPLPFVDPGRVLSVFDNWVSEVIVGLSLWSLFLLMFKYLAHRRQAKVRDAFNLPAIQALLGRDLFARDSDALASANSGELQRSRIRNVEQSAMYMLEILQLAAAARHPLRPPERRRGRPAGGPGGH
jgi:hypothetical protein